MAQNQKNINNRPLTVDDFKNDVRVTASVAYVQQHPTEVSDVLDAEGHQYVNLVQKGGGVLGVALVGYVYVLEQAGIRFMKMAGTSAGAINTSLMAIQKDKSKPKADYLIMALSELDMFRLVDGSPLARFLIKSLVKEPDFMNRVAKLVRRSAILLAALLVAAFVLLGLQHSYPKMGIAAFAVFVLIGLYFLLAAVLGVYIASVLRRLKVAGFGINPGDFFYDWVKLQMMQHDILTVADLEARAAEKPELKIRAPRTDKVDDIEGKVIFITSELVTQNKFELPEMAKLFRTKDKMDQLQPAGFVRASMSIPLFYESYYIKDIPTNDPDVKKLWAETFEVNNPPDTLRFVDGGILSNFPINLFFNKDIREPRLPTFGIDLDDSKPEDKKDVPENWSLGGYLGRMFNTVRFYYDKAFSLKNRVMYKGVGKVGVADYNWLNFFLTNEQKIDLFAKGAEAARAFLNGTDTQKGFDWAAYKSERTEYFEEQKTNIP